MLFSTREAEWILSVTAILPHIAGPCVSWCVFTWLLQWLLIAVSSAYSKHGYIAQWLEWLTADQQVPGSNPGVPFWQTHGELLQDAATLATR